MSALVCPCGSDNLWSEEVAAILYTVELTRDESGEVHVEYNGAGYEACDDGTTYSGNLWCRGCCTQLTEAELVPAAASTATAHPEHSECADGCGLHVTHVGPCLTHPGGRVCCEHDGEGS